MKGTRDWGPRTVPSPCGGLCMEYRQSKHCPDTRHGRRGGCGGRGPCGRWETALDSGTGQPGLSSADRVRGRRMQTAKRNSLGMRVGGSARLAQGFLLKAGLRWEGGHAARGPEEGDPPSGLRRCPAKTGRRRTMTGPWMWPRGKGLRGVGLKCGQGESLCHEELGEVK